MKTQFYSDGKGTHRATLEPENEVEKAMINCMKLYKIKTGVTGINAGPAGEIDGLELTFKEDERNV